MPQVDIALHLPRPGCVATDLIDQDKMAGIDRVPFLVAATCA